MLTQIWIKRCTLFSVPHLGKYETVKSSVNSDQVETCLMTLGPIIEVTLLTSLGIISRRWHLSVERFGLNMYQVS